MAVFSGQVYAMRWSCGIGNLTMAPSRKNKCHHRAKVPEWKNLHRLDGKGE
jgi:hypothetical protein